MRRRQPPAPETPSGVPLDLAAGPCVETWGNGDLLVARSRWRQARRTWAQGHGLADSFGRIDYRHLPRELRDRAPFSRDRKAIK